MSKRLGSDDFGVLTEADVAMVRWALTSGADDLDYSDMVIDEQDD